MDDGRKLSLKDKIKQSFCFSCCFRFNSHETLHSDSKSSGYQNNRPLYLIGASSQWIKSRAAVDLPEIKDKCRNIFDRIGGINGKQNRRRRRSTDFRYDPLSYSLNFEDESYVDLEDDAPMKDFSARLPASPPSFASPSSATADHPATIPIASVP